MLSRAPVIAYIGLGANLGNAQHTLRDALHALACTPGIDSVQASGLYRTAPHNATGPDYVNAVAQVHTWLHAMALWQELQALEQRAGRQRPYRNAPRTLDIDVLLYGTGRIDSPMLTVPHPRMWTRAFVLVPLAALAPQLVSAAALASVAGQVIARCDESPDVP